jgi:hypothetical protein
MKNKAVVNSSTGENICETTIHQTENQSCGKMFGGKIPTGERFSESMHYDASIELPYHKWGTFVKNSLVLNF